MSSGSAAAVASPPVRPSSSPSTIASTATKLCASSPVGETRAQPPFAARAAVLGRRHAHDLTKGTLEVKAARAEVTRDLFERRRFVAVEQRASAGDEPSARGVACDVVRRAALASTKSGGLSRREVIEET
jgi:hypothetical protein